MPFKQPRLPLFAAVACGLSLLLTPAMAAPELSSKPPSEAGSAAGNDSLTSRLAAVEKTVEAKRAEHHVPGAALVIVKDDRVILVKGFGLRDVERKLPVTPETLFAIGSCTKAFTAMTVVMSAEDGKLSLEDSPKQYLPYFRLQDPEADSKITVGDLLAHNSGLDRTDIAWYTGVLRPREVIRVAGQAKPAAKFREKFLYQNVMYLAAGEVVAKVQKMPWQKVVQRRILQPLGMTASNTSVREMQRAPNFSLGYTYNDDTKQTTQLPTRRLENIAPAGAINSNVKEMAQWLRLMLGEGVFEGRRLVSAAGFAELTKKRTQVIGDLYYGYGWLLSEWEGHRILTHSGGIDGFNAQVALMPDQKLGLALLTNVSGSPLPGAVMEAVWQQLVGRPEKPAGEASSPSSSEPPSDPAAEAGTYHLAEAGLDIVVAHKEGKLTLQATGEPEVALENAGGRRYKVAAPAPDGTFVTFRPSTSDPKETELYLEQGGGGPKIALARKPVGKPSEFVPPLPVEELMRKVVEALGGEANLRRHQSMRVRLAIEYPKQGLNGEATLYQRAPNAQSIAVTLRGAGRKIGTLREYFDGSVGGAESSFSVPTPRTGKQLDDARISADFSSELNWRSLFPSVSIKGLSKVDGEEVYELVKTPEKGSPVTDYISTKTFLVRQRTSSAPVPGTDQALRVTETFSDYRAVDGVMVSFKRVQSVPEMGEAVFTVREVRFNARIPDTMFRAGEKG
jgi:CubicO group peptidase (beta-lactamase class C family)